MSVVVLISHSLFVSDIQTPEIWAYFRSLSTSQVAAQALTADASAGLEVQLA